MNYRDIKEGCQYYFKLPDRSADEYEASYRYFREKRLLNRYSKLRSCYTKMLFTATSVSAGGVFGLLEDGRAMTFIAAELYEPLQKDVELIL